MAFTPPPKMTEREEAFCLNYIENGRNAMKAYEDAGYANAQKNAWRMLTKPHIQEWIEVLYAERNRRLGVSRDYVLSELLEQLQVLKADVKPKLNAKTGKPITDEDGNPVYVRNEPGITKVLELIGKLAGVDAFNDKMTVTVTKDQAILDAMEAGSKRLQEAPSFEEDAQSAIHADRRAESNTVDLGVQPDQGDPSEQEPR